MYTIKSCLQMTPTAASDSSQVIEPANKVILEDILSITDWALEPNPTADIPKPKNKHSLGLHCLYSFNDINTCLL